MTRAAIKYEIKIDKITVTNPALRYFAIIIK